jgi:hypothetical protein
MPYRNKKKQLEAMRKINKSYRARQKAELERLRAIAAVVTGDKKKTQRKTKK